MTEHLRMSASCFTSEFWKTFQSTFSIEHLWTNCLFHVQVSGYQLANTLTVSQVLFKHIVKELEIAIGRYSFNKNSWKLSVKNLIRSEAAGCKLTSIWKKTLSHIVFYVLCLHFLRLHHDYFFQRGFELVRAIFLSGNISKK